MRKILILAFSLVVASLVGCNKEDNNAATEQTEQAATQPAEHNVPAQQIEANAPAKVEQAAPAAAQEHNSTEAPAAATTTK